MPLTNQHVTKFLMVAILVLLCGGLGSSGQSVNPVTRSLESLKRIDYTKASDGLQNEVVGYSDLLNMLIACRAYSRGFALLPNYHEPILTRGQAGIAVFRKVSPSVVLVVTGNFKNDQLTDVGIGAGVIIDQSGHILTNWHVIAGYQVAVVFLKPTHGSEPPQNSGYGARLIAQDPEADLALLKIVKAPPDLTAVKFGVTSTIRVAEDVHIIGHPHGHLWSYGTGVISQIRDNYDWKYSDGSPHVAKVLQMQTSINPGNSGGPVLDDNGNMLGLVAMAEEGQNLNYAIAIDVIKSFVSRSMATRSRGSQAPSELAKGDFYTGQTKDGFSVIKAVYPDLVSYTLRDTKGSTAELIAETTDGAILSATRPNSFGGYGEWSLRLANGETVVARSAGTSPELISATTGE